MGMAITIAAIPSITVGLASQYFSGATWPAVTGLFVTSSAICFATGGAVPGAQMRHICVTLLLANR